MHFEINKIYIRQILNIHIAAYRFNISFRQISVQLSQVKERERYANNVDDNPEDIEYVVTKRAMYQRTAGRVVAAFRVRR